MLRKNKQGFTLIELLVVIAIIGLLATLSVVALNNARERARDSRRVSDVRQMQTAIELYYNANDGYPANLDALSPDLMDPIPSFPEPVDGCPESHQYVYTVNGSNSKYCLTYCLANDTGGIDAGNNVATEMSINAASCDI